MSLRLREIRSLGSDARGRIVSWKLGVAQASRAVKRILGCCKRNLGPTPKFGLWHAAGLKIAGAVARSRHRSAVDDGWIVGRDVDDLWICGLDDDDLLAFPGQS